MAQPPLTLIVAATTKNGIGKNGNLPWPMLKKEMAYFARVTKRVPKSMATEDIADKPVQNVVIMGRKTWDSIPPKLRPLKGRTNVVITRQDPDSIIGGGGSSPHEDVIVASSIQDGIVKAARRSTDPSSPPGGGKRAGRHFIIGGSSIYDAALKLPNRKNVLLTRIHRNYDCDTHFPIDLDSAQAGEAGWRRKTNADLSAFVEEEMVDQEMEEQVGEEGVVRYRFTLYEQAC